MAFNVDEAEIGVVLLGEYWHLNAGDEVTRTGRVMDVIVGDGLLGRVIDPSPAARRQRAGARQRASSHRARCTADHGSRAGYCPLQTGLKVIDALIPVGRGQRELILATARPARPPLRSTPSSTSATRMWSAFMRDRPARVRRREGGGNPAGKGAMDYTVLVVTRATRLRASLSSPLMPRPPLQNISWDKVATC